VQRRSWIERIQHIIDSISKIQQYAESMSQQQFEATNMAIDAVIMNFEISGEAVRYIPAEAQERYPDVSWAKLRAMRNIVIHEYQAVDLDVIWSTVRHDLPSLLPQLRHVLHTEESTGSSRDE